MVVNSRHIYSTNILWKPGTNIDVMDNFRSLLVRIILVNCFEFLESHFEYFGNRTVPVVNLVQICVVHVSGINEMSEIN
jgi:hypothetical protein